MEKPFINYFKESMRSIWVISDDKYNKIKEKFKVFRISECIKNQDNNYIDACPQQIWILKI